MRRDILRVLKHGDAPLRPKTIASELGLRGNKPYRLFESVLDEMIAQGMARRAKGGLIEYSPRQTRVEGVLTVTPGGTGFVAVEDMEDDLYVHPSNLNTALDGDRVLVGLAAPKRGDRKREAEILEVLDRRRKQVVGTIKHSGHFAFVAPDDARMHHDVYIPKKAIGDAKDGDKVVASIDEFDDRRGSPEGRVLQVIGPGSDPATQVLALAMSYDVRAGFPDAVSREAESFPDEPGADEIARREDLRHLDVFTIDPEDAQDFDDAIHLTELENGNFELGVHIADVSHYVQPDTALDEEALARATSVYLVDRVIPMLPEKLSNKVCSLRPDEDKLSYSCIMEVSPRGAVKDYRIVETVIRSKRRYTYQDAQDRLEGGHPDDPLSATILQAGKLAKTLTRKRMRSGSVDFDLPEVRVVLDDAGTPVDIIRKERQDANRMIEEFMLLANQTVARHVGGAKRAKPFIYRVHDRPDAERIAALAAYVRAFGYLLPLHDDNARSKDLNALLQRVKGEPEEPVIESAALRAMAKAKYSTNNLGHYGLGFSHYSHFTSPIRRYPDLIAHRLLKRYAHGIRPPDVGGLERTCEHCSERERAAVQAERESVKLKQVEYMQQHVGETFDGVVSGVTRFGVFVELSKVLVQGMVHVRDMDDDYYEFDERNFSLVGRDTGTVLKPGSRVQVVVTAANVERREIDLLFAD